MPTGLFNLIVLLPLLPLLAFVLIVLWTHGNKKLSAGLAIGGIGLSWLISWAIVFSSFGVKELAKAPFNIGHSWLQAGTSWQAFGFTLDPLAAVMLFMVPFVCLLIFIYSVGYMGVGKKSGEHDERGVPAEPGHVDPLASRFFAYIALFASAMIGLVLADNLLLLFIFWEIMGLCSYLLIGFWFARTYEDPKQITPKQAGLKAFLTTRIGDTIMLAGLVLLYMQTGTLSFDQLFDPATLEKLATTTTSLPIIGAVPWATLIAILIFWGAIGKSAQFPLHTWLPDAMEGPTPVSALIHAATMVSAGVYLIIRTYPLMEAVPHGPALQFIAFIGAFTALFAATIALAQNDIKKVLAYSTISQLGFMFAALGIGAYVAATFHLLTHAFFKALLFLGSGSVIHGMEHGHHELEHGHSGAEAHGVSPLPGASLGAGEYEHHEPPANSFNPQDMRNMGGLLRRMPGTAITFVIGGLALSGFPFITAGFWSKDEILADAFTNQHWVVLAVLATSALLTAFYTARQITMVFLGKPRTTAAQHASEHDSIFKWMVAPLVALAFFAVVGGWVGISTKFPFLGRLLNNPFHHIIGSMAEAVHIEAGELPFNLTPVALSVIVALGGLLLGWLVYRKYAAVGAVAEVPPLRRPDPLQRPLGRIWTLLQHKYYFDELYEKVFVRGTLRLSRWLFHFDDWWIIDPFVDWVGRFWRRLSEASRWADAHIVDAVVNGAGSVAQWSGNAVRTIQTGKVQNYLLVALVTVSILLGAFLLLPK
jgi:NADH-quinone oxidoreductase subunit L